MSAAPTHPARPPPHRVASRQPLPGGFHHAAGSSRVQVVVLAAARLRALHLDPLVTSSDARIPSTSRQEERPIRPLAPAPVFIERLRLNVMKPGASPRRHA